MAWYSRDDSALEPGGSNGCWGGAQKQHLSCLAATLVGVRHARHGKGWAQLPRPGTMMRMVLHAVLAVTICACAAAPAAAQASGGFTLAWPESQSPVTLGEFFTVESSVIPCQAFTPAILVINGAMVDRVSAAAPTAWDECGALVVKGGFTSLQLSAQSISATAEPAITLAGPEGCVYSLGQIEGHEVVELRDGRHAGYGVDGTATLKNGTSCAATMSVHGSLGVFGPLSGGEGLLLWTETEVLEREALLRAGREREARETIERQQRERGERERREHVEAERRGREAQERQEQAIVASLRNIIPHGSAARLGALLRHRGLKLSFGAATGGALMISWYQMPRHVHPSAHVQGVLVARGTATFPASGTKQIKIRLTRKGRRLLERARRVTLTASASFIPTGRPAIVTLRTIVLKR
jgi:hypothetical protein